MSRQVSPRVIETVELLTSELVTNAIIHATRSPAFHHPAGSLLGHPAGPVLVVRVNTTRVRVEVHDSSSSVPVRQHAEPFDLTGRGMAIVEELAKDWGVEHLPKGKRVWFEVPFKPSPQPAWVRTLHTPWAQQPGIAGSRAGSPEVP